MRIQMFGLGAFAFLPSPKRVVASETKYATGNEANRGAHVYPPRGHVNPPRGHVNPPRGHVNPPRGHVAKEVRRKAPKRRRGGRREELSRQALQRKSPYN